MAFSRRLPDGHAPSKNDIKRDPRVPCPNKNRPGKILSAQTVGYQHHTGHVVISTYPSAPHDLFTCIYKAIIAVARNICQALTLPMPEGRGFLVRQPLRRLRRIGVLHDFPKREFPCAPRYTLFQFMPLWIYLPKPCTGCSLQHSHLCRDAFHTSGNPIREHSNPLSVGSDSHKQSMSDSTGRTYRL